MHTLYKYICITYSRTCNRKITVVWVEGVVGRCWRITEIITINMAAENGTGSLGVNGVNGTGLKKGIFCDCG